MPVSHKKLDIKVDVAGLKAKLSLLNNLFGEYPYRGNIEGGPHSEMQDIWIRYNDVKPFIESDDFSKFADEHNSIWYKSADLMPVKKIIFDLMSYVSGERLGGVLITKLPPKGKIAPHVDGGWHASYYEKYYVPIQNSEGSIFCFEDGEIHPEDGDIYWFDNSYLHWVNNDSNKDRIAMIICIKTSDRFGELSCRGV